MTSTNPKQCNVAPVKVLLIDTNRWALSARLAISLARTGCDVSAVCPTPEHPLSMTHAVRGIFRYSGVRPLESLATAISVVKPDIVIPCCDRSVQHLHELYVKAELRGDCSIGTAALIERSLGPSASHAIVSSRYELLNIARQEGVRVPRTRRVETVGELDAWQSCEPLPWILKADGTWGGVGVRVIRSREGLDRTFGQLNQISGLSKAIKRLLVNRDPFWFRPWWNRTKRPVVAQSYIHGRPANCSVVCWNGSVLGVICVEVVHSDGLTGPATVVRIIENSELKFAAEAIASRLKLSGFFGLDFVIEEGSNSAYLIEMNPRTTPPCHIRLNHGRDLAGALWSQLAGQPRPEEHPETLSEVIAYFPQPAANKPDLLQDCFHDVPLGEPELVQELLHPFPERTLLFRLAKWLTQDRNPVKGLELPKNAAP